jgi:DNA repair exonuclease SbcCD ATPase subunit
VLTSKLGRDKYLSAITEIRHHPLVRDFEVLPKNGGSGGSLPDIFFDEAFIDFLKDNFSRLSRAIDRDPNIEQHQSHDGVDRDVVDTLRGERDEKEQTIQELKAQLMTLEQRIDQEQAEHRKTQQAADDQRSTLKRINDKLHDDLDKEVAKKDREHRQAMLESENKYNQQVVALNNKVQQAGKDANNATLKVRQEYDAKLTEANKVRVELERRLEASAGARQESIETIRSLEQTLKQTRNEISTISDTLRNAQSAVQKSEVQIKQLQQDKETQVKKLTDENNALQASVDGLKTEVQDLKTKAQDQSWKVKDAEEKLRKAEAAKAKEIKDLQDQLKKAQASAKTSQDKEVKDLQDKLRKAEESEKEKATELDDLIVLLSDLEEKRTKDKVCFMQLRGCGICADFSDRNDLKRLERRLVMRKMRMMMRMRRMRMKMRMRRTKMTTTRMRMRRKMRRRNRPTGVLVDAEKEARGDIDITRINAVIISQLSKTR